MLFFMASTVFLPFESLVVKTDVSFPNRLELGQLKHGRERLARVVGSVFGGSRRTSRR